jgi:hypothetical protein
MNAVRVADHHNGPSGSEPATMQDIPVPFHISCVSTADRQVGRLDLRDPEGDGVSSCPPPKEGVRTVIELTQIEVRDGGADGRAATQGNTLFMVQGLFIP